MPKIDILRDPDPAVETARHSELQRIRQNGSVVFHATAEVVPVTTDYQALSSKAPGSNEPAKVEPISGWEAWLQARKGIDF